MVIGNPFADEVDDYGDRLCNIESIMGAGSNSAFHNGYRNGWSGIGVSQMRTERRQRPSD